jgi:hypothetical protein
VTEPLAAIVAAAQAESEVWSRALLPPAARRPEAPWAALCGEAFAAGLEAIYEGYLLHHGRPRLFAVDGESSALLLGDFLYARGLAWIAALEDVEAIAALADLIALAAHARAGESGADDFALWAGTAGFLARRDGAPAFAAAKHALRATGDTGPLEALLAGDDLAAARATHAALAASR